MDLGEEALEEEARGLLRRRGEVVLPYPTHLPARPQLDFHRFRPSQRYIILGRI